jgi:hypothetical protein
MTTTANVGGGWGRKSRIDNINNIIRRVGNGK